VREGLEGDNLTIGVSLATGLMTNFMSDGATVTFLLAWRPLWEERFGRFQRSLEGYTTLLTLTFRFLYGLRTVAPFVIGMSKISTGKFILLNITGAITWAIVLGLGGYLFGNALEQLIGDIKHYEFLIFGIIAVAGILIWTVHFYHTRREKARSEKASKY
jgi:membrane protein DedA with SNARE-associated domain